MPRRVRGSRPGGQVPQTRYFLPAGRPIPNSGAAGTAGPARTAVVPVRPVSLRRRCDLPRVTVSQYLPVTVRTVITTGRPRERVAGPGGHARPAITEQSRLAPARYHLRRNELAMNYKGFGAASAGKPDKTQIF